MCDDEPKIRPDTAEWVRQLDHNSDEWADDPFTIWDHLRQKLPLPRSDRYGGTWLVTRYQDVAAVGHAHEEFMTRGFVISDLVPPDPGPLGTTPPLDSRPPAHRAARGLLLPPFAPRAVEKLEPATRAYCEELIAGLRGREVIDAVVDYAQHVPVHVIAAMMGFPPEDGERFRRFVRQVVEEVSLPVRKRARAGIALLQYLEEQVERHRREPQDDLTSYLLEAEMDGEKLSSEHVLGTLALLLLAGVDTTWSALGAALWHLAGHPADRRRLVSEPDLLPRAIEELLRAYAPVSMGRLVRDDMDWNGCPMKANEWVLLSWAAANRDPAVFADADKVILDREENRHITFGVGIHRCVGAHLARMELRVALEVWLEAFPDFHLADPDAVRWSAGQVRGPRTVPVKIEPA